MNLGSIKKDSKRGAVMNPTTHPTKKRNVSFDILIHIIST